MKKYIPVITVLLIIPSVTFAAWWNPATWFPQETIQSKSSSADANNQNLLNRISELEKKVDEQGTQGVSTTPTVISSSSNSDTILQEKVDSLTSSVSSLQSKLSSVQGQLKTAQSNYASCQANLASSLQSTTVVPAPVIQTTSSPAPSADTVTQHNTPFDYNNYVKVNISDFIKNPSSYIGWGTLILTSTVDDFLGAGDRGVENNYIEITDAHTTSLTPDKMMVQFDNANDYNKAIYSLSKGDLVDVWGVGLPSKQFRTVGSSDSSSSYEPVIQLQRIDKCNGTSCAYGNTTYVFSKNQ